MNSLDELQNLIITGVRSVQNGKKTFPSDIFLYLALPDQGGIILNYRKHNIDGKKEYIEVRKYRRLLEPDEVALYEPKGKNVIIGDRGPEFSPIEVYTIHGKEKCKEIPFFGENEIPLNKYLPFYAENILEQ